MRQKYSDYMHWAKTESRARFNAATSGVGPFPLKELPVRWEDLEINGNSTYGYAPLQAAIAQHCEVDPDCVVAAAGTSMANHLAMASLLEPGDEVLIEHPSYELLVSTASFLGANIRRFARVEENGFAIDPDEVRRSMTLRTKLIVLTNLHNPASVLTPQPVLRSLGELAREAGARVLVDEVYLDAVYENTPASAYHLGPEFVVTSSLTKVYGLSGLRCGWILAQPDLARAMWRLNDLYGSIPAHPAELLSVVAFHNLKMIRDRARAVVEADRALLAGFLDREKRVHSVKTQYGTTAFPRLSSGDVDRFLERLRREFDTSVVPGRFFGMPDHFRLGMGVNTAMFAECLRRISLALD